MKHYDITKHDKALVPLRYFNINEDATEEILYIASQTSDYLHHIIDLKRDKYNKLAVLLTKALDAADNVCTLADYLQARSLILKALTEGAVAVIRISLSSKGIEQLIKLEAELDKLTKAVLYEANAVKTVG